ncbi:CCA tRNA nucleotidyltransferase [Neobacillus sp. PS3-40]|uniref:CCA tRNA nucleotidyltransferase n=1 Tax=Neobacillus sp. PS3-40 TaxID=3070679 RepID=UPI0027E112DE|nr:CCA tRNA nucleotidyltransferase [Neobacillus sp. PS3-40]WML45089.1 CCA tRNA nucleotidyltransferase [Neobacillus sp. PS3-40]
MIEPFLTAVPVLKALENAGFIAYFVGGSVRDYILHKSIHDVDIATSATPKEIKKIFSKTVDIGIEHGTILVLYKNASYEITTFRTEEEYVDFRRPKGVAFIRSLNEDLKRRDFTMNAIAMDINGRLIDPFKGQLAISEKRIETVGKAEDRFQEDALRMMRAVRFMSQLSFKIENKTVEALSNLSHLLENIAVERKRAEFEKLLTGSDRRKALRMMIDANMFLYLPGLREQKDSIETLLSYDCENLNVNEMWSLFIYCLGYKGKLIENFLREWKLPIKQIKEIQHILHYLYQRFEKEWGKYDLYLAKKETIYSVETIFNTLKDRKDHGSIDMFMNMYHLLPMKHRSEMDVTGRDLMDWFTKLGGPWVNEMIIAIEQAILEGKVENKKTEIKEWLLKCNQI